MISGQPLFTKEWLSRTNKSRNDQGRNRALRTAHSQDNRTGCNINWNALVGFTIAWDRAARPSDHPVYLASRERLYEGMRKAGVPEGDKKTD